MYSIALLEKPVGSLAVLTYLHRFRMATISDLISSGWNRTTAGSSLNRLLEIGLVEKTQTSDFPRFRKIYELSGKGRYVADFAHMAKIECERCGLTPFEHLTRLPKGCLGTIVDVSRHGWEGVSLLLDRVGIGAGQAYKCIETLEDQRILSVDRKRHQGKNRILSLGFTPRGRRVSLVFDALDAAVNRISSESEPHEEPSHSELY